jgi:hypothetical protein
MKPGVNHRFGRALSRDLGGHRRVGQTTHIDADSGIVAGVRR